MRKPLEFRPNPELTPIVPVPPINRLFTALIEVVEQIVETRLSEIAPLSTKEETKGNEQLLKAKELAKILNCAEATINDRAERGEIPTADRRTRGKRVFRRFRLSDVQAALSASQK